MLEELQEKGITDTTVIIRKGQLYKVKKRDPERGRPRPSRGKKNRIMYTLALALVQIYVLFTQTLIIL